MSETQPGSGRPGVALLFEDANLSAHLREALVQAGARIVHEGPATEVRREDLAGNGAEVVVVNLDARVEEHLDKLYDMFDEDHQRIVFNDAEASSGLSGWDQARWARHLAAKLMDAHDVDPPRPAEARAIESHPTEMFLPDEEMPEAPPAEEQSPEAQVAQAQSAEQSEALTAELEALLAEDGDLLGQAGDEDAGAGQSTMDIELDEGSIGDADMQAIDAIPDAVPSASHDHEPEDASVQDAPVEPAPEDDAGDSAAEATRNDGDQDSSFEDTLRMFDQALADSEQVASQSEQQQAEADRLFEADEHVPAEDDEERQASSGAQDEAADVDEHAQAAAPLQDKATQSKASPYSLVDPQDDTPLDTTGADKKTIEPPTAPDWDLVDFDVESDDGERVEIIDQGKKADEGQADPSEFGIEKLSASEYLSPDDEQATDDSVTEPTFSLELEPIEQAVAPQMVESSGNEMSLESGLSGGIRQAVVLAAGSGEEARASLRGFLAAIDHVPEAAMIAVVHQQVGDDLQAIGAELNAANPVLSVRVAGDVDKVRHGDLVLVPTGKQALVESNGRLQLLDAADQPMASPSIDLTMTMVAKELGPNVLGIVFAGDAIDALAGAQAITDSGGVVWALEPSDYTDNTMVSIICEEQLARRTGTPQELAARMLEELS